MHLLAFLGGFWDLHCHAAMLVEYGFSRALCVCAQRKQYNRYKKTQPNVCCLQKHRYDNECRDVGYSMQSNIYFIILTFKLIPPWLLDPTFSSFQSKVYQYIKSSQRNQGTRKVVAFGSGQHTHTNVIKFTFKCGHSLLPEREEIGNEERSQGSVIKEMRNSHGISGEINLSTKCSEIVFPY